MVGIWQLVRLALRRDRISLPLWIVVLGVLPSSTVAAYEQLYPTEVSRAPLTAMLGGNPAIAVLYGPAFDLSTPGGFTAWRMLSFLGVFVAVMTIFTVTRHTRAEEDSGRHELLASGVVGRFAPLTAAVAVAGGASGLVGVLNAVTLAATGVPIAGSIAFGAAVTAVGLVFTGIAAITAQVVGYARTANGLACAVLGASFLLRGVGDASPDAGWLSWLSPIGWAQQVRPFAGERWWVLGLATVLAAAAVSIAYALLVRRDAGAGLRAPRAGPASAVARLRNPFALAWRLQCGSLLGWTVGFALAGLAFGAIALGVTDLIGANPQMREVFQRIGGPGTLIDAYLAQIGALFGMVAALFAIQATLRMRTEETAARLDPVLATSVTRLRFAASHLWFAWFGSAVVLAAGGAAAGFAHGLRVDDVAGQVLTMLGSTMAQLPAVWVVAGISASLFGLLPRHSATAWAFAGAFVLVTLFGPVMDLPALALDLSPFTHIPRVPVSAPSPEPLLWLAALATGVLAVGLAAFRRRDIG